METIDIGAIREATKMSAPLANFDGTYTFYYDETNNIRKFYVKETSFNSIFTNNFILGGLVHEGATPNVQILIDNLELQASVNEIKFKHIAKGKFIDCLGSKKLNIFLNHIRQSDLYIHYSSINILYWSIVDIVDSAIAHSKSCQNLGPQFANRIKNDLYKLARIEIDSIVSLFYRYQYPNIKQSEIFSFIEEMGNLFSGYLDNMEFHLGLESLRQILKEAKRNNSLPFIMNSENHILIEDFSHFYMRPIYIFKHSKHIFDNEVSIEETLSTYKIMDGAEEINNFSFVDSKSCRLTQLSDVLVGLIGKLHSYLNTNNRDTVRSDFSRLSSLQAENIDLLMELIDRSHDRNIGFLHATDSFEELSKINVIRGCRAKAIA